MGTSRIDRIGDEQSPALYEFYNVFPAGTLKVGGTYFVSVQAYDRNGAEIDGLTLDFMLRC